MWVTETSRAETRDKRGNYINLKLRWNSDASYENFPGSSAEWFKVATVTLSPNTTYHPHTPLSMKISYLRKKQKCSEHLWG